MSLSYNATVSKIPVNVETNVLTYSNGAGPTNLQGFIATGDAPGKFILRVGGATATAGTINTTYRTSDSDRTAYVVFPGISVLAGTNIYINVINEESSGSYNYEATLIYA
jgi:hypothetical protein